MSHEKSHEALIPLVKAIPEAKAMEPKHIPPDDYTQEAVNLHTWAEPDRELLLQHGLQPQYLDQLSDRADILRKADGAFFAWKGQKNEDEALWAREYPQAVRLKKELTAYFRFAFREDKKLLRTIRQLNISSPHHAVIQSLLNLAVFAEPHTERLLAINFDLSLLDEATQLSYKLRDILAAKESSDSESEKRMLYRNQAYTFLKEAVDEVKKTGKFVFRNDKEKRKGYTSDYLRKKNEARRERKNQRREPGPPQLPDMPVQ